MQKLKSGTIGVDKGSALLFSDYEDDGPMWSQTGDRSQVTTVEFSDPFTAPPTVQVSMEMWDTQCDRNQRVELIAQDITTKGFSIVFKTWGDTRVARARASWLAIGEVQDDEMWDIQ